MIVVVTLEVLVMLLAPILLLYGAMFLMYGAILGVIAISIRTAAVVSGALSALHVRLGSHRGDLGPPVLAGDRERARTLAVLRAGYEHGRLDLAELEARTDVALAARTDRELAAVTADLPRDAPVHLRWHELAAGFGLLLFAPTAIRVLGVVLVLSALVCARFRPVPLGFAAGVLVPISLPAALVLLAAVGWERTPLRLSRGPVLRV